VTQALFRPNVSGDYTNGLADLLDVVGQNYRENEILAAHNQKPSRKILGTENTHDRNQWIAMRDHAPYAGQFLWTGIDYLGESRRWPIVGHASGLLDRTARIRPLGRERESWWQERPMVAIARRLANDDAMPTDPGYAQEERHTQVLFSDWSPRNTAAHDEQVEVYSNCKEVELFLNGESLGKKEINENASPRVWRVAFAPGTLKAVASNDGKVMATDELRTAGAPAAIQLETKNARIGTSWDDVAIVRATIVDAKGIPVPRANDLISFSVSGPGVIAATDNGDNQAQEMFQNPERKAFVGQCVAYVKASGMAGKIEVSAKAEGLTSKPVVVRVVK
jgi:beta-galactosidase